MTYGNVNVDTVTTSTAGGVLGAGNASAMKNRLINGDFRIDQRNAGASVTPTTSNNVFPVDRWVTYAAQSSKYTVQQNAGSVTPPVGFTKYLGATSSSAYSVLTGDYFSILQNIEGFNTADLAWGTANAKTVTLSFQVYSSLTGTFGGAIQNYNGTRSYPYSYTISSANTWTQISVTIAGDTTGTWQTGNSTGMAVAFSLGAGATFSASAGAWAAGNYLSATGATSVVGTSGATFYITGVQLEVGSSATGFEYRQYGQELALCQRYYEKSYNTDVVPPTNTYVGAITTYVQLNTAIVVGGGISIRYATVKRTTPTVTIYSKVGTSGKLTEDNSGTETNATVDISGMAGFRVYATGYTAQQACNLSGHYTSSAEL